MSEPFSVLFLKAFMCNLTCGEYLFGVVISSQSDIYHQTKHVLEVWSHLNEVLWPVPLEKVVWPSSKERNYLTIQIMEMFKD